MVSLDLADNGTNAASRANWAINSSTNITGTSGNDRWRMEGGSPITEVAREFMNQPEFDTLYGANPSDATFVTKLSNNVLHRDPEPDGFKYWMDTLSNNSNPDKAAVRTQMLIDFSDSLENQVNVVGTFKTGIEYTPWHQG